MRLVKWVFIAVLCSAPGLFGQAPAQNPVACTSFATNAHCTATLGSNATGGNTITAYIAYDGSVTLATPTGCASSWSLVNLNTTSKEAFYIGTVASTGSCAVTESATNASSQDIWLDIIETSSTGTTVDKFSYTTSLGFCSSCSGPAVTPAVAGDLVITFVTNPGTSPAVTGTYTGFTPAVSNNVLAGYAVIAGSGSATHMTFSSGGANGPAATIAIEVQSSVTNPTFSPVSGTGQNNAMTLSITTSTSATLCYNTCTTNGCTPTTPAASTPGTCSNGTTLTTSAGVGTISSITGPYYTISVLGTESGLTNSSVETANYTFTASTPAIALTGIAYTGYINGPLPQTTTVTVAGGAPTICYIFNGTPATNGTSGCTTGTLYSGAITIPNGTKTLTVIAGGTGYLDGSTSSATYTITPTLASWNGLITWPIAGTLKSLDGTTLGTTSGNYNSWNGLAAPVTPTSVSAMADFRGGTNGGALSGTTLDNSEYGGTWNNPWNVAGVGAGMVFSNAQLFGNFTQPVTTNDGVTHVSTGPLNVFCTTSGTGTNCGLTFVQFTNATASMSFGLRIWSDCSGATQDCAANGGLYFGTDYVTFHLDPGPGAVNPCEYAGIMLETAGGNSPLCGPYAPNTEYVINLQANEGESPITVTFSNGSAVISGTNTLAINQAVRFTTTGALPTNFTASSLTTGSGTTYYVIATGLSTSQFEVSLTQGGTAVVAGSAGSGTQTATVMDQGTFCDKNGTFLANVTATAFHTPNTPNEIAIGPSGEEPNVSGIHYHYSAPTVNVNGIFSNTSCIM